MSSLAALEQFTWTSPLASAMDPEEYVFILSSLQPYADVHRLVRLAQKRSSDASLSHDHRHQSSSNSYNRAAIIMALSCMNQYELKRACEVWRVPVVHIDPECLSLQRSTIDLHKRNHLWSVIQTVVWGSTLAIVGYRQNQIVRTAGTTRWPTSRLASVCLALVASMLTASCLYKTFKVMRAIPSGYETVRVYNPDLDTQHLFLVRREYMTRSNPRTVVPMYLMSGLGLGTMLLGARIAIRLKR
ncbi:hypothetical protein BGZ73_007686 [Actinomortierella ambigua]|nr:hypothetical protein BGZ73_007686 [Actinomortierella ambigua]